MQYDTPEYKGQSPPAHIGTVLLQVQSLIRPPSTSPVWGVRGVLPIRALASRHCTTEFAKAAIGKPQYLFQALIGNANVTK